MGANADRAPVLSVRGLSKTFRSVRGADVAAVDDVTFDVAAGSCFGLVGESGSGKSTVASLVMGMVRPDAGSIVLQGEDVAHLRGRRARLIFDRAQMVFQNPVGSFDPRHTLGCGVAEGLRNRGMAKKPAEMRARALMQRCGLAPELFERFPHQVSGGQCQRAAIARALVCQPALLICDEATSALDVTVQSQIVELLEGIREETGMAQLIICHDMALVQRMCDTVAVMCAGRIVESGPADQIIAHPRHDYTKSLIEAVL